MASFERVPALAAMKETTYDVVVVGAGMTGAGVALDAAARGLRVALVDQGDVASGTSSKSSKMVHGGLRYLQQREFRLVYENLRERQRLLENAPYLVRPLPFLIPLFASNQAMAKALTKGYATALRLYDLTGGWRIGQRFQRVTPAEATSHLPTLRTERLITSFLYMDARGDDARVTLALARTAALDFNVDVATYVRVEGVERDESTRVAALRARDVTRDESVVIRTRSVVNATGVWSDQFFAAAENVNPHRVTPAKGVHLTVPRHRLPADVAAVFSVPGDRRSIFVVPFEDAPFTFIGTTDTHYEGPLDTPDCTPDDLAYLLDAVNAATSSNLLPSDVTGLWAGLRPLLARAPGATVSERTADLSRRHQVLDTRDGIVHVTGGKWTTYRQMAQDTVDALRPYVGKLPGTTTKNLRLHATSDWRPDGEVERHLYQRYGHDALAILDLMQREPGLGDVAIEGLPYRLVEFVWAARQEMTEHLIDLLTRRTRAHLHDARATLRAAPRLAALVGNELGWSDERIAAEAEAYRALVMREFQSAGLAL